MAHFGMEQASLLSELLHLCSSKWVSKASTTTDPRTDWYGIVYGSVSGVADLVVETMEGKVLAIGVGLRYQWIKNHQTIARNHLSARG